MKRMKYFPLRMVVADQGAALAEATKLEQKRSGKAGAEFFMISANWFGFDRSTGASRLLH